MSRAQAAALLRTLGFLMDELSLSELFDEVDDDSTLLQPLQPLPSL